MDPGAKVTYNGVEIGRVGQRRRGRASATSRRPRSPWTSTRKYLNLIPANVDAKIKRHHGVRQQVRLVHVAEKPDAATHHADRRDRRDVGDHRVQHAVRDARVDVAEKVDPIKLNQTLTATAQALDGLGDRFGQSIVNGNEILADLNPQMPQIRHDIQRLADLGDVYANASPDLLDGLKNAVTTARTLNEQQGNIDQALMAAVGFGNTGGDIFERGGPVPGARRRGPGAHRRNCSTTTAPNCSARSATSTTSQPKVAACAWRQRLFAADALGDHHWRRQPLRVSRQPAAGERARRPGGQAGLLAAHHP